MLFVVQGASTFSLRGLVLESFQKHCTVLVSSSQISSFLTISIHVIIVVSSWLLTQRYVCTGCSAALTQKWTACYLMTNKLHWILCVSGLFPSSGILNNYKTRRFGNVFCFRPQVKLKRHVLCWIP
jgi:hypothetical protein